MTPQALRGFEGQDAELVEQLRRDILETCALSDPRPAFTTADRQQLV